MYVPRPFAGEVERQASAADAEIAYLVQATSK